MYLDERAFDNEPAQSAAAACPEVAARLAEALAARPANEEPSACARPIYEALVEAGCDRAEVLAVAASLVDFVASEVRDGPAGPAALR